ncbi:MAG: TolB family protein, partial [Vicinamibacteria bacterium]
MRIPRTLLAMGLALLPSLPASAAAGPAGRTLTDPRSIASVANPDAKPIPIDDLYFTRRVSGATWSPDGREVAFTTDISGRNNLWKVSAAGGWPIQLAQSDDRQFGAAWSPDGKWIVFQQDRAGNELYDLYAIPAEGGQVVNLTNTPEIREGSALWSPDGKTIALGYKPKVSTFYDIALLDWETRQVRKLTNEATKDHSWSSVAWSHDGKSLYANRTQVGSTDSDIYRIDV